MVIDEDNMILEGSTLTQEFLQSHIDGPKEMAQDDIVSLVEGVVGNETEETVGKKLQGDDGQQEYLNNICGK